MHSSSTPPPGLTPAGGLLLFALAVFAFHQVPAFLPRAAGDALDLLTPFAVIGAAAALLWALRARPAVAVFALFAGVLYVDGHGIHLSANSIAAADPAGDAGRLAYFWDERLSHIEAVLGWFGLVAAFAAAERDSGRPAGRTATLAVAAALLGLTFFTSTVEGQTWWLLLATTPPFVVWALRRRGPLLAACAAAYVLAATLIAAWALAHGGVPEFSEVGLL